MSIGPEAQDPRERMRIPVTTNATVDASRFCLEECGFIEEAQEMAVVASVILAGGEARVSYETGSVPDVESERRLPNIVMTCKGPRKKFLAFGEYVCRASAKVDTE